MRQSDVSLQQLEGLVALAFDEQAPIDRRRKLALEILRYGSVSVGGFSSGGRGRVHEFADWQQMIRSALAAFIDDGGWCPPETLANVQVQVLRREDGSGVRLFDSDNLNDWRQRTILIFSAILERAGASLRRCPTCRKIYVRRGRREYCTHACSQRRRSSTHYQAHRDRILARRAEAYAKTRLPAHARRRLPRIATDAQTGVTKTPQLHVLRTKKARQSPRGKRRA